jgi:16S rRNA (guanine527-N7)-methyltransferase
VESPAIALQPEVSGQILAGWTSSDYPLSDLQISLLSQYLELLNKWNRVHSLTAIEDPLDQVRRHILDGLAVWPPIAARFGTKPGIRAADVGSGMGVPGLVLAIAMPGIQIDLIERNQKKAAFLRQACGRLGLAPRAKVIEADVSTITPNPQYDLITSRAFAALPLFLELTIGISGPHTAWAAMMGRQKEHKSDRILIKKCNKINTLVVNDIMEIHTPGIQEARHLAWVGRAD